MYRLRIVVVGDRRACPRVTVSGAWEQGMLGKSYYNDAQICIPYHDRCAYARSSFQRWTVYLSIEVWCYRDCKDVS
jgi:hypothetical protein